MTQQATTQQTLLAEFALLFQPLVTAAAQPQPGGLLFLFHQAGVDLDSLVRDTTGIADVADGISDSFQVLHELFESGDMPDLNEVGTLTDSVIEVTGLVRGLGQSFPLRSDVATTAEEIGQALLDYLIITHLQRNHRGLFSMLMLTGVVVVEKTDDEGVGRLKLHPGKISDLITDPMGAFAETYNLAAGSDTEDFDDSAIMLLILLQGLFRSLGIPAGIRNTPSDIVSAAGLDPETTSSAQQQLRVPIVTIVEDGTAAQAGLSIVPVPPTSSEDGGLAVVPFGTGAASKTISLGEQLSLEIVISGEAPSSYGLIARPESVSFANLGEGATPANLYVRLTLVNEAQDGSTLILGSEDGPRLEVGSFGIQMGFDYADGEAEFFVALPVKGGRITLGSPDGDGFLSKILPEDGASADFDLTVGWSSLNGFYFEGSSSLSVSLPTQISIGPLAIDAVHLEIGPSDDGAIALAAGATVAVTLGPVTLTVENLGLEAQLSFPENGDGNMGPLDLQIGVRPPDGAGISVDAGLVEGGGYLFFDRDKGEYAGSFELTIGEISVKAIGILTTKMPGGADGYSLMIIISGEFPSIQLGYGFTLNGVGGLAGINRSVEVEVLQSGITGGTVDSILFPEDPVANAPAIISDLTSVFPATPDRYVFGPMAIIGWGVPTLITGEIGIILEVPSPIRLLILGQLRMELPTEDFSIVKLLVDALGVLDFDAQEASIDATIRDSRLASFALSGDLAMRASWGSSPAFAMSAGGLHPQFQPPPGFPTLERMAISLSSGNNPRLGLEAYVAITSNTAQFGARLDLYASAAGFSIEGVLGFDALFQFSPFQFTTNVYGGVALKRGSTNLMSVYVDLSLSGPTPWNAKGKATFEVLFVKGSVSFDKTFGQAEQTAISADDPLDELLEALADYRNWSARLPTGTSAMVSLRETEESSDVRVHPLGELTFLQRIVPLNVHLDKFGSHSLSGDKTFSLEGFQIGGTPADDRAVSDQFAAALFFDLTESEKLSRPSFEEMDAGAAVSLGGISSGTGVDTVVEYDSVLIDPSNNKRKVITDIAKKLLPFETLRGMAKKGASGKSAAQRAGRAKFAGKKLDIKVKEPGFVVVGAEDMESADIGVSLAGNMSHAAAAAALKNYAISFPDQASGLQIVPHYEAMSV